MCKIASAKAERLQQPRGGERRGRPLTGGSMARPDEVPPRVPRAAAATRQKTSCTWLTTSIGDVLRALLAAGSKLGARRDGRATQS